MKKGFTLIELLVVITLVAIIGTITTQVFILSFKAQTKTESLKEVKQSGDYIMSVLEDMVRNSSDIQYDCNAPASSLTILSQDGQITKFVCDTSPEGKRYIASISAWSELVPSPTGVLLISNKATITDCSNVFRVVCPTPPLSPKYVFVNFTLENYMPGVVPGVGNQVSLDYQTTISLRNYQ